MTIQRTYISFFLFFIYIFSLPLLASTCVIVKTKNTDKKLENVIIEGIEEGTSPLGLQKNCSKAKLITGIEIEVFYRDAGQADRNKIITDGNDFNLENTGSFFDKLTNVKFNQILTPTHSAKGGRMLDDDDSIPGFPSGEILLPKNNLVFSLNPGLLPNGINQFTLYENGNDELPIYEIVNPGQRIEIPYAKLEQGITYRWVAQSSGKSYDDIFMIATKEDQDDFEQQLTESLNKMDDSETAKSIIKAEWCHQYEYFFDRDQELRKVFAPKN